MDDLCRCIIAGSKPILPPGYVPITTAAASQGQREANPFLNSNYLRRMKIRGGAFSILVALYTAGSGRTTLSKDQLCRAAQPFCDDALEANFHAGRPHGAWASNATLVKHGLLGVNKARVSYNERAGGLRAMGQNAYFLTREGELFMQALLQIKPEIRAQIGLGGGVQPSMGGAVAMAPLGFTATAPPVNPRRTVAHAEDSQRLMEWLATATLGASIEFPVSKARRLGLHDLASNLQTELATKGRQLQHESRGVGRGRTLTIRMERMATHLGSEVVLGGTPTKRVASLLDTTPDLVGGDWNYNSGHSPGHVLGHELGTPPKRPRSIPANVAAANAAMVRQALFQSTQPAAAVAPPPKVKVGSAQYPLTLEDDSEEEKVPRKPAAIPLIFVVEEESQRKPAAVSNFRKKAPPTSTTNTSRSIKKASTGAVKDILDFLESDDDDDDELLRPVFATKLSASAAVVDLTSPRDGPSPASPKGLRILIDNRERTRNSQPRYLRTQLNEIFSSHLFRGVWPETLCTTNVLERGLPVGDFAFERVKEDESLQNLPVCIERKRISDIVQRSASQDHWRQLLRGQEVSIANALLLEGDFRTADTFVAYGAANTEAWSPRRHVINDESTLLRCIARAILSLDNLRLIQCKDEQESLRAVAAYGCMSLFSSFAEVAHKMEPLGNMKTEQTRLADRLVDGGIPSDMAKMVGEEVGSVKGLQRLYAKSDKKDCREQLLIPFIASHCERTNESAPAWSTAIHSVFFSTRTDVSNTKAVFNEHKHLVGGQARLLSQLHQGKPIEQALDVALSDTGVLPTLPRIVHLELSPDLKEAFPEGNVTGAFYRLVTIPRKSGSSRPPLVRMWTSCGGFRSDPAFLHLMDGTDFVSSIVDAMQSAANTTGAAAARQAALVLTSRLEKATTKETKQVVMIRGLRPALDRLAKSPGYRPETKLMVDMVCAELSLSHNICIFQAIRKKGDMEAFVREFALACFYYQLLTRPVGSVW